MCPRWYMGHTDTKNVFHCLYEIPIELGIWYFYLLTLATLNLSHLLTELPCLTDGSGEGTESRLPTEQVSDFIRGPRPGFKNPVQGATCPTRLPSVSAARGAGMQGQALQ